ncbi:hypothetical protein FF38_02427 [Lucilia cuprina]|uniref:Uncharacterized protein n=1 Tax=Lucilia cuprina TaxID=7375 RepID=A0A0L0CAQ8_LUCCU|nr:hypothetical protein FF38_02427 [Lucilia cuprina]
MVTCDADDESMSVLMKLLPTTDAACASECVADDGADMRCVVSDRMQLRRNQINHCYRDQHQAHRLHHPWRCAHRAERCLSGWPGRVPSCWPERPADVFASGSGAGVCEIDDPDSAVAVRRHVYELRDVCWAVFGEHNVGCQRIAVVYYEPAFAGAYCIVAAAGVVAAVMANADAADRVAIWRDSRRVEMTLSCAVA